MTTAIKRRRGTTTQHATFTGLEGELTVDTTKDTVVVHDGATAGGFPLAKESQATTNVAISGGSINNTPIGASTANTGAFTTLGASGVATFSAGTVSAPAITATGDTNTGIFFPAADTIAFGEGGVEAMRINSSANVGIGTATPNKSSSSKAITVNNASGYVAYEIAVADAEVWRISSNGSAGVFDVTAGTQPRLFWTNGAERMRITSTGNVGVGTSSPAYKLQVTGTDGSGLVVATSSDASGVTTYMQANASVSGVFGTLTNHPQTFVTNNAERMRIDSSGNLLVGTTSFPASSAKQALGFDGSVANGFGIYDSRTSAGSDQTILFYRGTTVVGQINTTLTATSYVTSSDYRLKENIAPMTGALAKVQALKPVNYRWKVDGSSGQGFIAHELQAVVPDCVTGEKDAVDAEGKPVYQGIDTSFLVATLTAAIQELKAELDSVKAELQTLKGN